MEGKAEKTEYSEETKVAMFDVLHGLLREFDEVISETRNSKEPTKEDGGMIIGLFIAKRIIGKKLRPITMNARAVSNVPPPYVLCNRYDIPTGGCWNGVDCETPCIGAVKCDHVSIAVKKPDIGKIKDVVKE